VIARTSLTAPVDVSDWDTPGRRTGKVAMACSKEEIRAEVADLTILAKLSCALARARAVPLAA
jgi:hypothetical protein